MDDHRRTVNRARKGKYGMLTLYLSNGARVLDYNRTGIH